jgi:preprotein translocase subunit SecF
MFNIVRDRFRYFFISIALIVLSVIALVIFGLKPSIEFSPGTVLRLSFATPPSISQLKTVLTGLGHDEAIIQTTSAGAFQIRLKMLTLDDRVALEADLQNQLGGVTELSSKSTDPSVARRTALLAVVGVAVSAVLILFYMAWAWRKVPHPFRYGACSVISLTHDLIITTGVYAILAHVFHWEIDLMFIAGVLAILGFTDNNTVIIFDRIRENRQRSTADFETVVTNSVMETLTRSFNTSFTAIVTLVAVILFVGTPVQNFAVVFLIGILVGLFDSSFIAPALLVVWEKREWGRFIGRKPAAGATAVA